MKTTCTQTKSRKKQEASIEEVFEQDLSVFFQMGFTDKVSSFFNLSMVLVCEKLVATSNNYQ